MLTKQNEKTMNGEESKEISKDAGSINVLSKLIHYPMSIAAYISFAVMGILMLLAFTDFFLSIIHFTTNSLFNFSSDFFALKSENNEMRILLKRVVLGLELLMLAPLPFVLILGLNNYITSIITGRNSHSAKSKLAGVKALWISLLIGVFSTTLLEKAMQMGLSYEIAISFFLILLILMVYYFGLEKLATFLDPDKNKHNLESAETKGIKTPEG